jgi:AcrR family transcriptional regulator
MTKQTTSRRTPLSRSRVLEAAVARADQDGLEAFSMRRLAQQLGVVPMALYKHVANKEELLDGMVDVVVAEIGPPLDGTGWQLAVRRRILSARAALLSHPWAATVIESRATPTPAVLEYLNSMIGVFREGGLSVDLTHHVMHAMGSRILGFSQELFAAPPPADPPSSELAGRFPYLAEIAMAAAHVEESVVGSGCDDEFEFAFALDLLLDGIAALHRRGWTSAP